MLLAFFRFGLRRNAPLQDLPHLWCNLGELCEFRVVAGIGGFKIC
jgi:hypothetical protein